MTALRGRIRLALTIGLSALAVACGPSTGGIGSAVGPVSRKLIDSTGGSVTSADGVLTVTVPPGALATATDISIQAITAANPVIGSAYELAPAGVVFAATTAVTLTFNTTQMTGLALPVTQLWVDHQIGTGLWWRAGQVTVDGTAQTLTTSVQDFTWTTWGVVSASGPNVGKDLVGTLSLTSTLSGIAGVPFTASASVTLAYSGSDGRATYFVPLGTMTLLTSVAAPATSCMPVSVPVTSDNVVEVQNSPPNLVMALNTNWSDTCANGVSTPFDMLGTVAPPAHLCTRTYSGMPVIGPATSVSPVSALECDAGNPLGPCSFVIDCGTLGSEIAQWNFAPCTPGVACASANPCHTAAISCATGSPVCTDNGNVADGTSCGTNLVCGGGVCNACTEGAACTSANPCDATATFECSSGFAVCTDRTFVAAGTSCGTDLVCSATGVCGSCTQGAACTPTVVNPCALTDTIECSSGAPVCTDRTFAPAGTSCGTGLVCSATGVCGSCSQGATCTSTNPCAATATIACGSGAPVCTDQTFVAAGTSCGSNEVCSATGVCGSCSQGATCTSTNPCAATATIACASGLPVCADQTFVSDGTSCGSNLVCSAGACVSCTANAACTPANACHVGVEACATGPVCTDTGTNQPDGTACGAGQSCNAGTCVPSQTVAGTRYAYFWPDAVSTPTPTAAPDVQLPIHATIQAIVSASGTVRAYPGTFAADGSGTFSIPNVPTGSYWLTLVDGSGVVHAVETPSTTVDLGYDLLGRIDATPATLPTAITLVLTNLDPWDPTGNQLQLTAANANVWDLAIPPLGLPVGATDTTGLAPLDWSVGTSGALDLLESADVLYLHQLASASVTLGAGSYAYAYADKWASLSGIAMTNGLPATFTAALATPATTSALAIDWRTTQFEAMVAQLGPGTSTASAAHLLAVGANAHPLAFPAPQASAGAPTLFLLQLPTGTGDVTAATPPAYGHFLDPLWNEWRDVEFRAQVSYLATGASTAFVEVASVGQREAMSGPPAATLAPALGPVQAPLVAGSGAIAAAGVTLAGATTTPTISWTAPAVGSPTSYTVTIYLLGLSGTGTTSTEVGTWVTPNLSVPVPAGLLAAGSTYYARITANARAADGFATAPQRFPNVGSWASILTSPFTP